MGNLRCSIQWFGLLKRGQEEEKQVAELFYDAGSLLDLRLPLRKKCTDVLLPVGISGPQHLSERSSAVCVLVEGANSLGWHSRQPSFFPSMVLKQPLNCDDDDKVYLMGTRTNSVVPRGLCFVGYIFGFNL